MKNKQQLDAQEQDLLDAYENEDFQSDLTEDRKNMLKQIALESTKKDKRMNIRISSRDMKALQRRALKEGLPYQTLVSSILHKYLAGGLKEVTPKEQ